MRRTTITLVIASLAAMSVAGTAQARLNRVQTAVLIKTVKKFRAVDTDRSRQLSNEEFTAAGGNAENFDAIDANANGELGFWEVLRALAWRIRQR
jgi:hypothetical protein